MSTFAGKIAEIPEISVDNFLNENERSLVYFLSHCHTDHMLGLGMVNFQNELVQRPDVFLYASPISVAILKNRYKDKSRYPPVEEKLKEIPIHHPTLIKIPGFDKYFTVTALPAGHCPGSVMFLFEINGKNVLYTGDYRVSARDLEKYEAFYSLGKIKTFDKIYLDTTFFSTSYRKLPPRDDVIKKICSFIRDWLQQSPNHIINIVPSANYGSEFLYMEVAKAMQMPIHVDANCYNVYKCIPEMDKAITLNARETQIHSNCGPSFKEMCSPITQLVRKITPSTLWWKNKNTDEAVTENHEIKVCYSSHASFEEINDFLLLLKPAEIEPCVVPANAREKNKLMQLLEEIKLSYTYKSEEQFVEQSVKLFQRGKELHVDVESEEDDLPNILHSPTSNFKRRRKWLNDEN